MASAAVANPKADSETAPQPPTSETAPTSTDPVTTTTSTPEPPTAPTISASAAVPPPATTAEPPTTQVNPATTATTATTPTWPETGPDHPLTKLYNLIPSLTVQASHTEIYGIELSHSNPFLTKLICQKFLRANQNDVAKAEKQLLETLKWRKAFDPAAAAAAEYPVERFEGLGAIVEIEGVPGSKRERDVVTFNVYGSVKDGRGTFGDLET